MYTSPSYISSLLLNEGPASRSTLCMWTIYYGMDSGFEFFFPPHFPICHILEVVSFIYVFS